MMYFCNKNDLFILQNDLFILQLTAGVGAFQG